MRPRILVLALLGLALGLVASGCGSTAVHPLPRIAARRGVGGIGSFVEKTSVRPFAPAGFNHTVLGPPNAHHVVFNVGQYNAAAMETALTGMARTGANVVRLWAWGDCSDGTGVTGGRESSGVSPAYMDNFVDFLQRCRHHRIYVVAILDECPLNKGYGAIAQQVKQTQPCAGVSDYNEQYLGAAMIAAKAALIRDFIGGIKRREPALLSTVLAWSLCNEAFVTDNQGPFAQHAGQVTTANRQTYDMADRARRQACWDEGIAHWANELTAAVKSVDPEALVTAGMWTSDAQQRLPVNGLQEPRTDSRYPPRPSVLAAPSCQLDFIDIHVYPFDGRTTVNLATNEFDDLKRLGKPVLCGEYGIFRELTKPAEAMVQERELRKNVLALGYAGPLLWIWDLIPNSNTYTAWELGLSKKQ